MDDKQIVRFKYDPETDEKYISITELQSYLSFIYQVLLNKQSGLDYLDEDTINTIFPFLISQFDESTFTDDLNIDKEKLN